MGLTPVVNVAIAVFSVVTIASLASLGIANLFLTLYDAETEETS
jgi:hypothetical protein